MFEDGLTAKREGDEDEGGVGGAFARRQWEGEHWVRVCLTWTGRFWDSSVVPPLP
jgi:hypothetical protein